ncbi:MAG: tetratricopeptide repeat protein [Saprospiraceae bacterium]|nr:tetratricopeptide repeat protein [Saprospiraceae bacterium]
MSKIALLEQYLRDSPQDPFLHFAMAKEYEKLGDWELSLNKYLHLVREHPDYVGTYYHLGRLYMHLDKASEARATVNAGIACAEKLDDRHSASELEELLAQIESEED